MSIAKLLLLDFLLGSRFDTVLYTSQHGPVIRPGKHRNLLVIHDIIPLFYGSKLKRIYYQKVLPRIIGNIDIAIVISEKTRQDVSSIIALRDAQKITLIRSGMEHQSRSKSIHRAPIVLAIYRKEAWKNSNALIEAFVQSRLEHYQLVMVGDKPLPIRLTPMTATCRVPPLSRVKLGIGWSRGVARDAEQ